MKRILTIQDISCVGKCSLTVALPIISAAGVETAVLPTAVLSNHTAFEGFTFHDLTADIPGISAQWKKEGITFDSIYTGYLGSEEQISLVKDLFRDYKQEDSFYLVDPAMADNGKLYPGFSEHFAKAMAGLCGEADLIVPNLTEAAYLLGQEYIPSGYDRTYIETTLRRLTDLGCKEAALTGVSFEKGKLGAMAYNAETGSFFEYYNDQVPVSFHGTGDVFASSLFGAKQNGLSTGDALTVAVDYTLACIRSSMADEKACWYGVNFEPALPFYLELLDKYRKNGKQ